MTIGIATGLVAYTLFLRHDLQPSSCRWCDGSRPDGVNAVDRFFRDALVRDDVRPASFASNVLSYGVAPVATGVLLSLASNDVGQSKNALLDLLLVAQTSLIAVSIDEAVKAATLRERPSVHRNVDDEAHAREANKVGSLHSFPAGHTLSVFALTSAAGTIASMRRYPLAPLIWIAGSMLGVAASYLRIAADQHYFSDTLAGAAIGVVVGAGIPWLFHRPVASDARASWLRRATLTTQPTLSGRTVSLAVAF